MDAELPDELLYGRAGYLYALLYLNTEIASDTVPQSIIKEVGLFFSPQCHSVWQKKVMTVTSSGIQVLQSVNG